MAVEQFISAEENGKGGAYRKVGVLLAQGYKILAIKHTMVPMAGSNSSPYSSTWGRKERGYLIIVDTDGYERADYDKPLIPEIEEE